MNTLVMDLEIYTLEIKDGFVSPPNRPGIGIELNQEVLNKYKL